MLNLTLELSRVPIVTRIVCASSFTFSLLFWVLEYRNYYRSSLPSADASAQAVAVVPILTILLRSSYYLAWTFFTASFVSANMLALGISIATLLLGGRYLEFSYSSKEVAKFYAVLVLVPNVVIYLSLLLLWVVTRRDSWLDISIHGNTALQAGILVAFKHLVPEHTVTIQQKFLKIRVKHFPVLFVLSTIVMAPIFGNYSTVALAILGFLSGWTYLRFYKSNIPDLGAQMISSRKGDASETFALSQFFPDVFHAPIDRIATIVYNGLVFIGICSPFGADLSDGGDDFGRRTARSGIGRVEAERRRTLALRVLDERHDRNTRATVETMIGPGQLPPQVNH